MKLHTFLIFALLLARVSSVIYAQGLDTSVYRLQRAKVNEMLNARVNKFGSYSESLQKRSGIFGWKTKNDIQQSAEILREIVEQDDEIFKQLKLMFDYKELEREQINTSNQENELSLTKHMHTINKLQAENEKLQTENKIHKQQSNVIVLFTILFAVLSAILGCIAFKKKTD